MAETSLSNNDIIIAVIGLTGAGKSTFINLVTGKNAAPVGDRLNSCTQAVMAVGCAHPNKSNKRVVFLDTPGFNDTQRSDVEVLKELSSFLLSTYAAGIKLNGILYLHDISHNRMAGPSWQNLQVFRDLCGVDSLQNVVFVTTMWENVEKEVGTTREQQLESEFWETFIVDGAQVARHDDSREGAWSIVQRIENNAKIGLQIQVDVIENKRSLSETPVWIRTTRLANEIISRIQNDIVALKKERSRAEGRQDYPAIAAISRAQDRSNRRLNEATGVLDGIYAFIAGIAQWVVNTVARVVTLGFVTKVW